MCVCVCVCVPKNLYNLFLKKKKKKKKKPQQPMFKQGQLNNNTFLTLTKTLSTKHDHSLDSFQITLSIYLKKKKNKHTFICKNTSVD